MPIKTLEDLFTETLKDMYYVEKKLVKTLPTMEKKAVDQELKDAINSHAAETETHVARLEQVFEACEIKPQAKKCEALEGLLEEANEVLEDIKDDRAMDAAIISSAQTVEHYEMARYGALIAWAKELGWNEAADIMQETLDEEESADQKLSDIAEDAVNQRAAA
ncbi:MAG: ferritin-like domain-containing protein [Rhizobiales bacterium]|nr:ferritin-like domain-containing protein [Hyphomicrobiales bacterium]